MIKINRIQGGNTRNNTFLSVNNLYTLHLLPLSRGCPIEHFINLSLHIYRHSWNVNTHVTRDKYQFFYHTYLMNTSTEHFSPYVRDEAHVLLQVQINQFSFKACEIPSSKNKHSHYVCDDDGEVKCMPGWIGDLCDVPKCRHGCDPLQGYCINPEECICKLGYYGQHCNKCIPLPGCQRGYCNVSFECICHEGWDGIFCSERKYWVCSDRCFRLVAILALRMQILSGYLHGFVQVKTMIHFLIYFHKVIVFFCL